MKIDNRVSIKQIYSFVNAVNISLESDIEMSSTLNQTLDILRNETFDYAQKKTYEAPVKMLLPLVLLIFPTIFIVIFEPIAINFMKNRF